MKLYNKKYHRTIAYSLILLVLMTSVSFTIDKHYCEGELQSISIIGKAEPCQTTKAIEQYCPVHKKMMKMGEDKSCCENETTFIDADNDLKDANLIIPTIQQLQQFTIAYLLIFHVTITTDEQTIQTFAYHSPLILRDIYVLLETFLL